MLRRSLCVLPGIACHITQRGVDRRETFSMDEDRRTYLRLVRENLSDAGVKLLGWCLMTNHVHLLPLPAREDSLSIMLRRVHGRYAQYYNARSGRTGHLWQNCFLRVPSAPVICGRRWRMWNGIQRAREWWGELESIRGRARGRT
jgi:putative transposase